MAGDPLWRTHLIRIRDDFGRERREGQPIGAALVRMPAVGGMPLAEAGPPPLRPRGELVAGWVVEIDTPAVLTDPASGEPAALYPGRRERLDLVSDGDALAGVRRLDRFCELAAIAAETLADLPTHARGQLAVELGAISDPVARWVRELFDLALRQPCPIRMPATPTVWIPGLQAPLDEIPLLRRQWQQFGQPTTGPFAPVGRLPADDALLHWQATLPDVFTASMYACDVLLNWANNPPTETSPSPASITPADDQAEQAEGVGEGRRQPAKPTPKRKHKRNGRPRQYDPKLDKRISDAWESGQYRSYKDMKREFEMSSKEIGNAIKRHRVRQVRKLS